MTRPYKRRIKLIKPRLQLRLIGVFVGLSALSFLLQALLLAKELALFATQLPTGGEYLASMTPRLLSGVLLFSFGLLLPLIFSVGILITFRIAGPVYRFEKFLTAVARGEDSGPCVIRQGDEMQDLCQRINEAVTALRARAASPVSEAVAEEPLRRAG